MSRSESSVALIKRSSFGNSSLSPPFSFLSLPSSLLLRCFPAIAFLGCFNPPPLKLSHPSTSSLKTKKIPLGLVFLNRAGLLSSHSHSLAVAFISLALISDSARAFAGQRY